MTVVVSRQAQRDFAAQVGWLHRHSPQAGRRAATVIIEAIDQLNDFPHRALELEPTVREKHIRFGRDGFVLRYRIKGRRVTILRIYHSRQDRT